MAQYYAQIQGNRGMASRMGSKASGMWGHLRGWSIGVMVYIDRDEATDKDVVSIHITGGSHDSSTKKFLGRWVLDPVGNPVHE